MKTPYKGLRTVINRVPDLAEATTWYAKAFGVAPYFEEPFYVGFNVGGFEMGLLPYEGDVVVGDNVLAYWGVDNVEEQYNALLQHGASAYEKPTNVGGKIIVAAVKDPWGNVLGLIYNPDFKIPTAD